MMQVKKARGIAFLTAMIGIASALWAQQAPKAPLTNADVVKMVKAGLSESVVVSTIQANSGNYDISPDGLIALKNAGVTPNEMNALVAVASGASPAPGAAPNANAASAPPAPRFQMPVVAVIQNGAPQQLPLEKTQLAETKTKPTSMASLAGDSALTQAIQAGVGNATMTAASHINSNIGNSAVQQAGNIFGGVMSRRKPSVTYVWGVPSPASPNVLETLTPQFSVNFANTPGVNPDDFEPAIVKLTPAQNTCRIVGATEGKEDARSSSTADWQIYSSFLEERVAPVPEKVKPGEYKISPKTALFPGEYAIVLRPVSKSKKFSGGDVARAQGDGFMFDAVWSFQIANDAQ
jgi:hypothetical protein